MGLQVQKLGLREMGLSNSELVPRLDGPFKFRSWAYVTWAFQVQKLGLRRWAFQVQNMGLREMGLPNSEHGPT